MLQWTVDQTSCLIDMGVKEKILIKKIYWNRRQEILLFDKLQSTVQVYVVVWKCHSMLPSHYYILYCSVCISNTCKYSVFCYMEISEFLLLPDCPSQYAGYRVRFVPEMHYPNPKIPWLGWVAVGPRGLFTLICMVDYHVGVSVVIFTPQPVYIY